MKLILAICFSLFTGSVVTAEEASLYDRFSYESSVQVFSGSCSDRTGKDVIYPSEFKVKLEQGLRNMGALPFNPVFEKNQSEIMIETDIVEYAFNQHGDRVMNKDGTGDEEDALRDRPYARIEAFFKVRDSSTNEVLWADRVVATVADEEMTEITAPDRVCRRLIEVFIKKAFAKR